jgi:hypothetical protein
MYKSLTCPISCKMIHGWYKLNWIDYNKLKTGINKSNQLLVYYCFQMQSVKWWKKPFFKVFYLSFRNTHILYWKTSRQNFQPYNFTETVAEDWVNNDGTEISEQSHANLARGHAGRWHCPYTVHTEFEQHARNT